jgi:hypothetical protein
MPLKYPLYLSNRYFIEPLLLPIQVKHLECGLHVEFGPRLKLFFHLLYVVLYFQESREQFSDEFSRFNTDHGTCLQFHGHSLPKFPCEGGVLRAKNITNICIGEHAILI